MPNASSPTPGHAPNAASCEEVCAICNGRRYFRNPAPFGDREFGRAVTCVGCNGLGSREAYLAYSRVYAGIPLRVWTECSFATFDPHRAGADNSAAKFAAFNWADEGLQVEPFLVLSGSYGVGKSHLATAAARKLIEAGVHLLRVYSLPRLLDELRATQREGATRSLDALRLEIADEPVLILDDLGAERRTDFGDEQLAAIIDHRWQNGMRTLITTNVAPAALEPRVRSRILDSRLSRVVPLSGPDQRLVGGA